MERVHAGYEAQEACDCDRSVALEVSGSATCPCRAGPQSGESDSLTRDWKSNARRPDWASATNCSRIISWASGSESRQSTMSRVYTRNVSYDTGRPLGSSLDRKRRLYL